METKDYTRQEGILPRNAVMSSNITVIGAGSVGSFVCLMLAKMGYEHIDIYDSDIITPGNIPNQFYQVGSLGMPKVEALAALIRSFEDMEITAHNKIYHGEDINPGVTISAVDSMAARRLIYPFVSRDSGWYIDARMGAGTIRVFCVNPERRDRYAASLQVEGARLPCTARTILYSVLSIAGVVGSVVKKITMGEIPPFCINHNVDTFLSIIED